MAESKNFYTDALKTFDAPTPQPEEAPAPAEVAAPAPQKTKKRRFSPGGLRLWQLHCAWC